MQVNATCTNMGFESGDYSGWCRRTGVFLGYTAATGYNVTYDPDEICTNDPITDDDGCSLNRFEIVTPTDTDTYIDLTQIQGTSALRLGNRCVNAKVDRIQQTFVVSNSNHVFAYRYALALQDTGVCSHISYDGIAGGDCDATNPPSPGTHITNHSKPYFTVYLESNGEKIECSEYLVFGDDRIFDFDSVSGVLVKDWTDNQLNLLDYVNVGDQVTVVAEVADCSLQGHFGYAYFEASCSTNQQDVEVTASKENACIGEQINFSATPIVDDYIWTFYDQDNSTILGVSFDANPVFNYTQPGYYKVTYGLPSTGTTADCLPSETLFIDIENCGVNDACENCNSFSPMPGETYWLAAWVSEEHSQQVIEYTNAAIELTFSDAVNQPVSVPIVLRPSGEIIEGWQRIIGRFTIPNNTVYFNLNLLNQGSAVPVYFDDIRVHPINGSLTSFVYDPVNFRLVAQMDENNYAIFYDYGQNGELVRVKKETKDGVFTIQETRSSNPKTIDQD